MHEEIEEKCQTLIKLQSNIKKIKKNQIRHIRRRNIYDEEACISLKLPEETGISYVITSKKIGGCGALIRYRAHSFNSSVREVCALRM